MIAMSILNEENLKAINELVKTCISELEKIIDQS